MKQLLWLNFLPQICSKNGNVRPCFS